MLPSVDLQLAVSSTHEGLGFSKDPRAIRYLASTVR